MSYLTTTLSLKLANEIININKGNMRTKRKCSTLNFLKAYHASIIENRPLLKFKFIFRSRIKRKRKRVIFFKKKYFSLKRFRNITSIRSKLYKRLNSKNTLRRKSLLRDYYDNRIAKNFIKKYK